MRCRKTTPLSGREWIERIERSVTRLSICLQSEIVSSDNRSASPRAHRAGGEGGAVSGNGAPERDWLHRPRGGGGGGGCSPRAAHHKHIAIPGVTAVPTATPASTRSRVYHRPTRPPAVQILPQTHSSGGGAPPRSIARLSNGARQWPAGAGGRAASPEPRTHTVITVGWVGATHRHQRPGRRNGGGVGLGVQ